jgi:hypothetical protein
MRDGFSASGATSGRNAPGAADDRIKVAVTIVAGSIGLMPFPTVKQ